MTPVIYGLIMAVALLTHAGYVERIDKCVADQVEYYNDICAEARPCQGLLDDGEYCTNRAAMRRGSSSLLIDMHYEGVVCGAEAVGACAHE
jgi:hypothetical protein